VCFHVLPYDVALLLEDVMQVLVAPLHIRLYQNMFIVAIVLFSNIAKAAVKQVWLEP